MVCVLALLANNRCSPPRSYITADERGGHGEPGLQARPEEHRAGRAQRRVQPPQVRGVGVCWRVLACVRACMHGWMGGGCLGTVNYKVRHIWVHMGADP